MKDEYVIISKTAIEKRIEELESWMLNKWQQDELRRLKILLSQSTPLANIIKQTLETAAERGKVLHKGYGEMVVNKQSITNTFEEIFENLKL